MKYEEKKELLIIGDGWGGIYFLKVRNLFDLFTVMGYFDGEKWRSQNMRNLMDIGELRRRIVSGHFELTETCNIIESGKIVNNIDEAVEYNIIHGRDMLLSAICDKQWKSYLLKLLKYIEKQNYDEDELSSVLSNMQTEHFHWDWFCKSMIYTGDEYEWFYMFANSKPQGACLIYHPKPSVIDGENIFYIEFIAVAPWNSDNIMQMREFKGIGSLVLKCVLGFAVNTLNLKPGFSLLSLPQTVGYYKKLGMENYQERDEKPLVYFEMPRTNAANMLGVA